MRLGGLLGRSRWQLENMVMRPFNWKWFEKASHFARFKTIKRIFPWFNRNGLNVYFLPINEDINLGAETPVPLSILEEMIDRVSHRVIVDVCMCRKTLQCKKYPHDIGCLMMGRSALEIDPSFRREVGSEEAKLHARRAVEAGLVPIIGKVRVDNFVFGIKNKRQLLSVCFCCECCCISRFAKNVPVALRSENLHRLDGLFIDVGATCDGCGACAGVCFLDVIRIEGDKAVIGEGCVGCGRCAHACKRGAIGISLENPKLIDQVCSNLETLVDIS